MSNDLHISITEEQKIFINKIIAIKHNQFQNPTQFVRAAVNSAINTYTGNLKPIIKPIKKKIFSSDIIKLLFENKEPMHSRQITAALAPERKRSIHKQLIQMVERGELKIFGNIHAKIEIGKITTEKPKQRKKIKSHFRRMQIPHYYLSEKLHDELSKELK